MTASVRGKGPKRARAVAAERIARQRAAERKRKSLIAGLTAGVVLIAAAIIGVAVHNSQKPATVSIPQGGDRNGITIGQPGAKARIEIFADYLCPFCKQFEAETRSAVDKWVADGTASVKYAPVAILDDMSTTDYSTRAAAASGCAADGGKFAEFSKALFDRQPAERTAGLPDSQLITIGTEAGAGSGFAQCVKDGTYTGWAAEVTDNASKAGMQGTPTVKVNGKILSKPTLAALTAAVEQAAPQ
jgi:protein-disulfide isomerase